MHIIFNTFIICNSSGTNDGNKTCVKQLRLKYDGTCNSEKLMHHGNKPMSCMHTYPSLKTKWIFLQSRKQHPLTL
jgi:hypothetical protein